MRRFLAAFVAACLLAPSPSFAASVELSLSPVGPVAVTVSAAATPAALDAARLPVLSGLSAPVAATALPVEAVAVAAPAAQTARTARAAAQALAQAVSNPGAASPALSHAFDNAKIAAAPESSPVLGAYSSISARLARWSGSARAAGLSAVVAAMTFPSRAQAWPDGPPDSYIRAVANSGPAPHPAVQAAQQAAHQAAAQGSSSTLEAWLLIGGFVAAVTAVVMYFRWRDNRAERPSTPVSAATSPDGTPGWNVFTPKTEKNRDADLKKYPGGRDASGEPITFATVAGQEEAKAELEKVLHFHKNAVAYKNLNPRVKGQKGILLYGPPGTGKTLLAQALANEAGMHFVKMNGSDFINQYVGTGPAAVRRLFEEARGKGGPTIVFIDEIEAILKKRTGNDNNKEEDKTVNAILAELDGFEKDPDIIVIGATNLPDVIDPAALRGGRFALQVPVGLPDLNGRKAVFDRYLKGMKLGPGIDSDVLARQTPGTAGADIEYIVNRASLEAGFKGETEVSMERFMEALDERAAGLKRKILMTPEEKRVLAYHEGGHALMSHLLPDADPVRKVTVVSAGLQALGYMQAMPEQERTMYGRKWLVARMAVAYGGRVAEELATGEQFSGASNDIEQASAIARQMVMKFGMSEKVGPISFDELWAPSKAGTARSERMNRLIDAEVKALTDEAYALAQRTLTENRAVLDRLAAELQEHETLRGPDLERLIPGAKKLKEPK